jgi:hypothetical protein
MTSTNDNLKIEKKKIIITQTQKNVLDFISELMYFLFFLMKNSMNFVAFWSRYVCETIGLML